MPSRRDCSIGNRATRAPIRSFAHAWKSIAMAMRVIAERMITCLVHKASRIRHLASDRRIESMQLAHEAVSVAIRCIRGRFKHRIGCAIHCVRHADRSGAPSSAPIRRTNSSAFVVNSTTPPLKPSRRCNVRARGIRPLTSMVKSRICAARCRARRATSHPIRLAIRMHLSSPVASFRMVERPHRLRRRRGRSISPRKRKPCAIRSPRTRRTRRRRSVDRLPPTRARRDAGHRSSEASRTSAIRLRSRASRPDIRPDHGDDEDPERHRRSDAFPRRPFPAQRSFQRRDRATPRAAAKKRKRKRALVGRDR